jgi:hypothetical protein
MSRKIHVDTPTPSMPTGGDFVSIKTVNESPRKGFYSEWVIDIHDPTRWWRLEDYRDSLGDYSNYHRDKWRDNIGLAVRTEPYSHDIIMTSGRGWDIYLYKGGDYLHSSQWEYHTTFVAVQNGIDSVVGGYGFDFIVSENWDYSEVAS